MSHFRFCLSRFVTVWCDHVGMWLRMINWLNVISCCIIKWRWVRYLYLFIVLPQTVASSWQKESVHLSLRRPLTDHCSNVLIITRTVSVVAAVKGWNDLFYRCGVVTPSRHIFQLRNDAFTYKVLIVGPTEAHMMNGSRSTSCDMPAQLAVWSIFCFWKVKVVSHTRCSRTSWSVRLVCESRLWPACWNDGLTKCQPRCTPSICSMNSRTLGGITPPR